MRNRPRVDLAPDDVSRAEAMVLASDRSVIALNKPSGLACQTRDPADDSLDRLLWAFARRNGKRPHLVHRLDRDTSGVILAAQTKPAAACLHTAFEHRQVRKTYLALVSAPEQPAARGALQHPLADVRKGARVLSAVVQPGAAGARVAETRWACLGWCRGIALLRVTPRTGRMHQIRAHLAHSGLGILGDPDYGNGQEAGGIIGVERTLLHAFRLEFPHPDGGAAVATAPVPDDFSKVVETCDLDAALEAAVQAVHRNINGRGKSDGSKATLAADREPR